MALQYAAIAAQMAANQFDKDINRKLQRESDLDVMGVQQEYNKDLMTLQNAFSRQNLYDSSRLTAEGMRSAGISPDAAFAGGFSPVAGGSGLAGTPSHSGSQPQGNDFNALLMRQQMAQTENVEAATAKLQADAEKTHLENENMRGANEAVKPALLAALEEQERVYKAFDLDGMASRIGNLRKFINSSQSANVGSLETIVKSFDVDRLISSSMSQKLDDLFEANFKSKQIEANIADDLNQMTKLGKDLLKKRIRLTAQQAALFLSGKQVNEKQLEVMTQQIKNLQKDLLSADFNNLLTYAQMNKIENSDINTLFEKGKNGEALRAAVVQLLESAGQSLPFLLMRNIGKNPAVKQEIKKEADKKVKKYKLYSPDGQPTFYESSDDFNTILR